MRFPFRRLLILVVLAASLAACAAGTPAPIGTGPASTPPVDVARVTDIARNAFAGYNAGDYSVWSRDWSPAMKSAIKEADFLAFRDAAVARVGRFAEIRSIDHRSPQPGVHSYRLEVAFEKATIGVRFGFHDGSPLVEGVNFEV